MSQRTSISFAVLRERAWREAWKMSAAAAQTAPPVPLHDFCAQLRIRRVEFLPLISTAGIGPLEDGYVVYISSRARLATRVPKKHLSLTREDFSYLPAPLRFNVAHEMAHVFFFNVLNGDCRNELLAKHWRAIENSCNQMARVLLLPKRTFLQEIGVDLFAIPNLRQVISRFRISPQVLIYRFRLEDMRNVFAGHDEGLIAYITTGSEGPRIIAAHALGTLAKQRWPYETWRADGTPLESLHVSVDIAPLIQKKEHLTMEAKVHWRDEQVIPCKIEFYRLDPFCAIVSVRLTGHLQSAPKVRSCREKAYEWPSLAKFQQQ